MKRYFLFGFAAFVFVFAAVHIDPRLFICRPASMQIENDAVMGYSLPRFGTIKYNVESHGSPRETSSVIRTLHAGERVRLHELSPITRDLVMIAPAEWIPLEAVCGY